MSVVPVQVKLQSKPSILIWIERGSSISDRLQGELLARDTLVVESNLEDLDSLKASHHDQRAYLFSLDTMLAKAVAKTSEDNLRVGAELLNTIKAFLPGRSLVHCSTIDQRLEKLFKEHKIPYITKNFYNDNTAVETIDKWIRLLNKEKGTNQRGFMRLSVAEGNMVKVELEPIRKKGETLRGWLKDFSLSGLGIKADTVRQTSIFEPKDFAKAKVYFPRNIIKLDLVVIARVDHQNVEVGVQFNISDERMVSKHEGQAFNHMIYQYIKELIRSEDLATFDFSKIDQKTVQI